MSPESGGVDRAVPPRAALPKSPAGAGVLALFVATTFLSAFLLFSIQPLFAKMVLPVLGGSSSVWAVALLFFQAALLAGYGYAHLLTRYVPFASSGFVHLGLAALALLALPVGLPETWREPPLGDPYLWQLGLFAVAVGLPFVAVAANAPLLQAWFSRSGHPHAQDPYFLYGASNLGSLIALLGYPFLFEPAFGLTALSRYWALLYVVLIVAIGACFALVRRRAEARHAASRRVDARRCRCADMAPPHRLVRPGAGAGGVADRLHHAHRHRHRLGAAALGAAARTLPVDVRARLPVAPAAADVAACCRRSSPPCCSRCSSWRRPSTTNGCSPPAPASRRSSSPPSSRIGRCT